MKRGFKVASVILLVGSLVLLAQVPRENFGLTFGLFTIAFGGMLGSYLLAGEQLNFKRLLLLGILLRGCLFFFEPNWSEDGARFLWDGELLRLGYNPYLSTPADWHGQQTAKGGVSEFMERLIQEMNSPNYTSVYPPINQTFFWIGAWVGQGEVGRGYFGLRCILLIGEVGVYYLLWMLLVRFELPTRQILLYWLNPLVILEVVGNMHFEGAVLFFLLAALLSLTKYKFGLAGLFWGLAIGIKLLPLLFVPAFYFWKGVSRSVRFWGMFLVSLAFTGIPLLYLDGWRNFLQSIQLFQGKFEFNASIYYLFRALGYWLEGYNTIWYLTKAGMLLTLVGVVWISSKQSNARQVDKPKLWVQLYLLYFLLQPVVHPWYLIPGIGLALLARQSTFLIWSFAAIFSYQAYSQNPVHELPFFIGLEYGLVLIGLYLDYFWKRVPLTLR